MNKSWRTITTHRNIIIIVYCVKLNNIFAWVQKVHSWHNSIAIYLRIAATEKWEMESHFLSPTRRTGDLWLGVTAERPTNSNVFLKEARVHFIADSVAEFVTLRKLSKFMS